jgi:hypothetical protein
MRKLITVLIVVLSLLCGTVVASAGNDPNVVLVNPTANSTVYSSNLLISVKLTQAKKIRVAVFEEQQIVNGTWSAINVSMLATSTSNGSISNANNFKSVPMMPFDTFTSNNNLSFYTKQVNNLKPGLYRIRIETLDPSGKTAVSTADSYVAVKEKTEEEAKLLETPQTGTMQFLQNLLKTIFGNGN